MSINWLDIVLLLPLAWGLVRGLYKGLILSIGSFLGLILGIYIANAYASESAIFLLKWFVMSEKVGYALAYFMIFVGVAIVCFLIAKLLDKLLHFIMLTWLNRLLGALFGVLKYALVLSVCINLVEEVDRHLPFVKDETRSEAILYTPLQKLVPAVLPYVHFYTEEKNEEAV